MYLFMHSGENLTICLMEQNASNYERPELFVKHKLCKNEFSLLKAVVNVK